MAKQACYRCGERKVSVKKCGKMWWCSPCRKELKSMSTDPNEQRYIPDDEKKPRTVLVNNVDRVLAEQVGADPGSDTSY